MQDLVKQLFETLKNKNMTLVTAESCTGGMVSSIIVEQAGSSEIYECGFITYSNASKVKLLSVSSDTLNRFGAVSKQTALEMAKGALEKSTADIAVSITGIAGPSGGTPEKPVGTVYIGVATNDGAHNVLKHLFLGDRNSVRTQATHEALSAVLKTFTQ